MRLLLNLLGIGRVPPSEKEDEVQRTAVHPAVPLTNWPIKSAAGFEVGGVPYSPGAILHEAIVGAFRASGGGFEAWCAENRISPSAARSATFGQARGPRGRETLRRLIEAAGPEIVHTAYLTRMKAHAADLNSGVA